MRANLPSAAAILLLLPGCGRPGPTEWIGEANRALGSGDSQAALEKFREALAGVEKDDERYLQAKLGEVEALIDIDADEARDGFLALAQTHPEDVGPDRYVYIALKLSSRERFGQAIELLDAGLIRFGSDEAQIRGAMDRVVREALNAKDVIEGDAPDVDVPDVDAPYW